MCGRFALYVAPGDLAALLDLEPDDAPLAPRYNIAPTQPVMIVRAGDTRRELVPVRWGLIPSWAKDPGIGARMINARSETVAEKPSFRAAFKARRCLIPGSGFYEWQTTRGKRKQPYFIRAADGVPLAFAGLWERWRPGENEPPVESCTILTTDANVTMAPIHDRMPVILAPADYATWLGEAPASPDELRALCRPAHDARLVAEPVSTAVNTPSHDGPDCIAPLTGRRPSRGQMTEEAG